MVFGLAAVLAGAPATLADGSAQAPGHDFGFEVKANYRDSDQARFGAPFVLPDGRQIFLETVEAGNHAEVSVVTLWYKGQWQNGLAAKVKLDLIDRYDRNPTSEDNEWDLDEAWLRWGPEVEPGDSHEGFSAYAKIGKFPKFERQDDRHLESYGLVSTSFNRAEDAGLELGFDIGRHFYLKASLTQGNPVFIRDYNALAGDNGIPTLLIPLAEPELKSGIPGFYDADIEDLDFSEPEVGLGLGFRFGDPDGRYSLDVLAFAYERDLADTIEFEGSFYGGDLDLLRGPFDLFEFAFVGREKEEIGLNIWLYAGGFSFFGQYVDQDLAGLVRKGIEAEVSWDFELPVMTAGGIRWFPYIAPAVRYSKMDPEFGFPAVTPLPSAAWDWDKLDIGLRLGILETVDLTLEYAINEFVRAGVTESADELLATVRWQWSRSSATGLFGG